MTVCQGFWIALFVYINVFFLRDFFHRHSQFTGQQVKGVDHLCSSLPLPSSREDSDISLQPCMWDDNHVFLIVRIFKLVTTTQLPDEIYHLLELTLIYWCRNVNVNTCLLDDLILDFVTAILIKGTGGSELASTIALV